MTACYIITFYVKNTHSDTLLELIERPLYVCQSEANVNVDLSFFNVAKIATVM